MMTNANSRFPSKSILSRAIVFIGFIFFAVSPALAQQTLQGTPDRATGWRKIVSSSGGFQALMPKEATVEEELIEESGLKILMRTFEVQNDFGAYVIGSIDVSSILDTLRVDGTVSPKARELLFEVMFDAAQAEGVKGLPATMELELAGDTAFNGAKGRLYHLKIFDGIIGEMRLLHHKEKVFIVLVADLSDDRAENMKRFLSSIQFL